MQNIFLPVMSIPKAAKLFCRLKELSRPYIKTNTLTPQLF